MDITEAEIAVVIAKVAADDTSPQLTSKISPHFGGGFLICYNVNYDFKIAVDTPSKLCSYIYKCDPVVKY